MPTLTASGKIFVHTTIKKEAREELRIRGIPIGVAAEMWLKNIDKLKLENNRIKEMEDSIIRMEDNIRNLILKNQELEEELKKNGKNHQERVD